jgi:hypothetical protein
MMVLPFRLLTIMIHEYRMNEKVKHSFVTLTCQLNSTKSNSSFMHRKSNSLKLLFLVLYIKKEKLSHVIKEKNVEK